MKVKIDTRLRGRHLCLQGCERPRTSRFKEEQAWILAVPTPTRRLLVALNLLSGFDVEPKPVAQQILHDADSASYFGGGSR